MHRTLKEFWRQHSEWSQKTFGLDSERGPIGPIRHLEKEVQEILEKIDNATTPEDLLEEFADAQFLLFDAVRRAKFTYTDLTLACFKKLEKNKGRVWKVPSDPDQPIEHVREEIKDDSDVYS